MLTVAAHQPGFIPWMGYFHKMLGCDVFVVMDDLQFEAQNFQNRNRVKVNNGTTWLQVPLERGPREQRICDKRISQDFRGKEDWRRRAWLTIKTHYGRAPYFRLYAEELEAVLAAEWTSLVALDLHLTRLMMKWLGVDRPLLLSSELALRGRRTERLVDLCTRLGADTYLSGRGGSVEYLELHKFAQAGVRVAWQRFRHPVYPQLYPALGFVSHLGAIDLILNCGPRSAAIVAAQPPQAEAIVEGYP
jgi:hypothetical protein